MPTLSSGDILLMDNLSADKAAGIREAIESSGVKLVYLPPYLPDLNPIEKCRSKIKTHLRAAKARIREALEQALKEALSLITLTDIKNWFKSCGYTVH